MKYKARLVVMGCFQRAGIDYFNVDASVMNINGTRICLAEWISDPENIMERWDVVSAFPNADIDEDIWVSQPEGYQTDGSGIVLKLKKALYGTKQAARAWQNKVRTIMESIGGTALRADKATYVLMDDNGGWLVMPTHVDDFFPVFNKAGRHLRDKVWTAFSSQVELTNFGEAKQMLGAVLNYDRKSGTLKISHDAYAKAIVEEYLDGYMNGTWVKRHTPCPVAGEDSSYENDEDSLPKDSYPIEEVIGKLWWTVYICRPDLYIAVSRLAKRVTRLTKKLLRNLQWLLSYLATTLDYGITMTRGFAPSFDGAADSSWADQKDSLEPIKMKSTLGWFLRYRNCLVAFGCKTSDRICGSSTEAECMAIVEFARMNTFVRRFVQDIGCWSVDLTPTLVLEDNTAAIALAKENAKIKRSRHFAISWYQVKEFSLHKEMVLKAVSTEEQCADLFTKPLARKQFELFRNELMGLSPFKVHLNMFQATRVTSETVFYAVAQGVLESSVGIYTSWAQCGPHVVGIAGC